MTNPAQSPAKAPSRLAAVQTGKIHRAKRRIISGPEGVGKSTLIAGVPGLLFLDIEGGSEEIDCNRYTFRDNDPLGHVPKTWGEVRAAVRDLIDNPSPFRAVGLDTLDRLEFLATRYCLNRDSTPQKKLSGLESYGYGKGPQIVLDEMLHLFADLDRLRDARGMDVYLTAHVVVRKAPNPNGEEFERWDLKADAKIAGWVAGWADDVGFMHFVDFAAVNPQLKSAKVKAWSANDRVIEWDRSPTWRAKARTPFPPRVEIPSAGDPWAPMQAAIDRAARLKPEEIVEMIDEQLVRLADDQLTAAVKAGVDKVLKGPAAKIAAQLGLFLHELRRREPAPVEPATPDPDTETTETTEET